MPDEQQPLVDITSEDLTRLGQLMKKTAQKLYTEYPYVFEAATADRIINNPGDWPEEAMHWLLRLRKGKSDAGDQNKEAVLGPNDEVFLTPLGIIIIPVGQDTKLALALKEGLKPEMVVPLIKALKDAYFPKDSPGSMCDPRRTLPITWSQDTYFPTLLDPRVNDHRRIIGEIGSKIKTIQGNYDRNFPTIGAYANEIEQNLWGVLFDPRTQPPTTSK